MTKELCELTVKQQRRQKWKTQENQWLKF
jgi:hypothetical protein